MFEAIIDEDNRGQVGIGTLIVFIAMVLVAAIAAGVLINTAGFLQTQAEDTGTESTEQVANNLNIITEVGEVSPNGDTIGDVQIGLQPAAGSDDLNLEEVSLQYVSDDSFSNLVHVKSTSVNEDNEIVGEESVFNTVAVTAEDGQDNVMTDNADRYELVLPLGQGLSDVGSASEGDEGLFYEVENAAPDASELENLESNQAGVVNEDDEAVAALEFSEVNPEELPTAELRDDVEGDDSTEVSSDVLFVSEEFINGLDNTEVEELVEGETAELTFTTETGAQTQAILQVPDSLAGEDPEDTVDL